MALNSNFRTLTADNIEGLVDNRNYLKSSFENGTIQGWTEMAVTLTSGLPTGTPTISATAAGSLALTATTLTPLSGSRSLLMNVPTSLTAGHGFISDEFTLDRMDLGKVLTVSFDYERTSGTLNFSGLLGSQTLMVYIYDASAGGNNWIQPAGFLGMNQSSGPGRVSATFQSSVVSGQKYRVAVIASQAVGSACSLEFDNFTCSRVTAPIGPVVTDWVSYTPTLKGTGSDPTLGSTGTITGRWRRVGDSLHVQMQAAASGTGISVGSGDYYITVPSGLSIDTSRINASVGTCEAFNSGTYSHTGVSVVFNTLGVGGIISDNISGGRIGQNHPSANWWSSGDFITINAQVPISGWSSATQQSSDTDTRVVAARLSGSTTSIANSSATRVTFTTKNYDTHSAASFTTFVAPVSGFYRASAIAENGGTTAQFSAWGVWLYKNGVYYGGTATAKLSSTNAYISGSVSDNIQLNAGDTVEVYVFQNSGGAISLNNAWFSIERISGPSVVAATESVNFVRRSASGQQINSGVGSYVDLPVAEFDSHNGWVPASGSYNAATGQWSVQNPVYRVPVSGTYLMSGTVGFLAAVFNGAICAVNLAKNGASFSTGTTQSSPSGSQYITSATCLVKCNAGDTLSLIVYHDAGAARNIQNYGPERTYLSIVRVGN